MARNDVTIHESLESLGGVFKGVLKESMGDGLGMRRAESLM